MPLPRLLRTGNVLFFLTCTTLVRAAQPAPAIVTQPDGTLSVTFSATHKFTRNTDKLKAEATAAASAYCASHNKQLKILSLIENKSMFLVGDMASATLTFKALDLTDPELSSANLPAATTVAEKVSAPATNEAMYADLLRLDDLRKKGILSDPEFAAEKKKVLERSR